MHCRAILNLLYIYLTHKMSAFQLTNDNVITFGEKHKGKSYDYVLKNDLQYCAFCLKKRYPNMVSFVRYVLDQDEELISQIFKAGDQQNKVMTYSSEQYNKLKPFIQRDLEEKGKK